MLLTGHMDEGVQRNHGREGAGREVDVAHVGAKEFSARDEASGPADLNVREVDSGHAEAAGEQSRRRDPGAASEVQYLGVARQGPHDRVEPGPILALTVPEAIGGFAQGTIPVGCAVPTGADDTLPANSRERRRGRGPSRHHRLRCTEEERVWFRRGHITVVEGKGNSSTVGEDRARFRTGSRPGMASGTPGGDG